MAQLKMDGDLCNFNPMTSEEEPMNIEDIQSIVNEIARQQIEYMERTLAEIITKYDFIVGSMECKRKLMNILPKGANIIYSPFVENSTMIYAIKKFDIMDLFENPYKE